LQAALLGEICSLYLLFEKKVLMGEHNKVIGSGCDHCTLSVKRGKFVTVPFYLKLGQ